MKNFTYDSTRHRYTLNGRRIISNTDVLRIAGLSNYNGANSVDLHFAAQIGSDVHKATWLHDKNKSWKEFDHIAGYVEAWIKCRKDFGLKPLLREFSLYDPELNYATTIDCFAESNQGPGIFQLKTVVEVSAETAIQTAAEEHALLETWGNDEDLPAKVCRVIEDAYSKQRSSESSKNRWAIQLRSDGNYHPHRFDKPGYSYDFKVFCSALTIANWLVAKGKAKF